MDSLPRHKSVEELTFTDDFMFGTVMKNKPICKGVLERLLHIKVGKIEYPSLQKTIAPFYESKGIRLDVYVAESSRIFDIEIQASVPLDLPKRTRYYQSLMDVDNLLRGQSYAELKHSYVIFICTQDPFDKGLPVYTFENTCRERAVFFLMTEQQKYFIIRVRTAKKKTMNCMRCCVIFARNRQQVILHRALTNLLKRPRTTKRSGAYICH